MRLLFDENMPKSLAVRLADLFPGSMSAEYLGLASRPDHEVWALAREMSLTLVSKDRGLIDRLLRHGPPPKLVTIQAGNRSLRETERLLRESAPLIHRLGEEAEVALLVLPARILL